MSEYCKCGGKIHVRPCIYCGRKRNRDIGDVFWWFGIALLVLLAIHFIRAMVVLWK